ncbi:MAG: DUF4062 domain-containing protein [Clostridia bacterium]|nr:DUF4062 domain-containing protein [Clostridia bacterium]
MKFFISSTYEDLFEIRRVAINTLEGLMCSTKGATGEIIAMEFFCPTETTCKEECLEKVKESDIVIGIYGKRYGWEDKDTGVSMTELEFDCAVEHNKPILSFILKTEDREKRQKEFIKNKVYRLEKLCGKFETKLDFANILNASLKNYFENLEGYSYNSVWSEISHMQQLITNGLNEDDPDFELQMEAYIPGKESDAFNDIFTSANSIIKDLASLAVENNAIHSYAYECKYYPENVNEKVEGQLINETRKNSDAILLNWEIIHLAIPNHAKKILLSTAFLKLCYMQHRLLTEIWTESLRLEVIDAKKLYLNMIKEAKYID